VSIIQRAYQIDTNLTQCFLCWPLYPPPPSRSPTRVPSFIYVWVVWEKNFG